MNERLKILFKRFDNKTVRFVMVKHFAFAVNGLLFYESSISK